MRSIKVWPACNRAAIFGLSAFLFSFVPCNSSAQGGLGDFAASIEQLAVKVSPTVVQIVTSGYDAELGGVTSRGLLPKSGGSGSGVIVDADGFIVTNHHVVDNATRIRVILTGAPQKDQEFSSILKPRERPIEASLIGSDQETDLAVLKIPRRNLPYLEFGDSDELRQGQLVLAFGSPFGLDNSVSMGVVSSVARQFAPDEPMIYIQTDATINPGNSGGALVNAGGQLMGINSSILSQSGGSDGIGFAAPSNIVEHVYRHIREHGRVRRGTIGVNAQTLTPTMADGLGLSRKFGVILGDVYPGRSADKAGLKVGDIILTINDKSMENGRQFDVNLYSKPIGQTVAISFIRGTIIDTVDVGVVERPNDPGRFADMVSPEENLIPELGILAIELNAEIIDLLPQLRRTSGVLVASRQLGGASLRDGFLPGDVIYEINRFPIGGLAGLRSLVTRLSSGNTVVALVERRGRLMYLTMEID